MTKVVGFRENMVESIITVIFCHPDKGVGAPTKKCVFVHFFRSKLKTEPTLREQKLKVRSLNVGSEFDFVQWKGSKFDFIDFGAKFPSKYQKITFLGPFFARN